MQEVIADKCTITPSKIVCVGRNYYAHIKELGNEFPAQMVLFSKPNSAISTILYANHNEPLHYEGELCFIYEDGGFSAIGFGFDLTKRGLQSRLKEKGLPWERAKSFDGAAVFSEFTKIQGISNELTFKLINNGEQVQMGSIELMIHKPHSILSEIQSFMSLNNGDIIMTGTPKGVGVITKGDVFSVTVKDKGKVIIEDTWLAH